MRKSKLILFTVSVIVLMLGQLGNFWGAVSTDKFEKGLTPLCDGFVFGKMAYAEQEGIFKHIALMIQVAPPRPIKKLKKNQQRQYRRDRAVYSKHAYFKKTKIINHNVYLTKTALHMFFYSGLNTIFKPDPHAFLSFLYTQKALLFSIVLSLIIVWMYRTTNLYAALLMLFSFAFSPVVTQMGTSLYFTPYTFFLPFLAACILLHLDYLGKIKFTTKHYLIVAGAFLFNMLFQSFEFISTKGLMAVTPFIFYGILKGDYKEMISRTFKAGLFYGGAIFIGLFFLLLQIKTVEGSWAAATEHIVYSYSKRASGELNTKKKINKRLRESMEASRAEVLSIYFNENALYYENGDNQLAVKYKTVFYLYLIASLLLLFFQRKIPTSVNKNMTYALIVGALFAMLAPLSWHIIFRGHSYIHFHFNTILWFMPFMIFGCMLVGYAIELGVKYFKRNQDAPLETA